MPRLGGHLRPAPATAGTILQASYAHYAGKYNEAQFGANSPVANPALVLYDYNGPAGAGPRLRTGLRSRRTTSVSFGIVPDRQHLLRAGCRRRSRASSAPRSASSSAQRGMAKLTYVNRVVLQLHRGLHRQPDSGRRTDVVYNGIDFGTFDNIVYRNSDLPRAQVPGADPAGELPAVDAAVGRRPLDRAAEERRQLRG